MAGLTTSSEIRCRFVFSIKNDELTPDFPDFRGGWVDDLENEIRCRFVFSIKNDELTPDFRHRISCDAGKNDELTPDFHNSSPSK